MGFLISLRLGSVRRLRPSLSRHNVELSVVMDVVAIGEDLRALGRDGSAEGAPLTGAASILSTRMLLMPAFAGRAGDSRWKIGHRLSGLASSTVNEGESIHFQAHKRVFLQGHGPTRTSAKTTSFVSLRRLGLSVEIRLDSRVHPA